jgi:hypothetical protein
MAAQKASRKLGISRCNIKWVYADRLFHDTKFIWLAVNMRSLKICNWAVSQNSLFEKSEAKTFLNLRHGRIARQRPYSEVQKFFASFF